MRTIALAIAGALLAGPAYADDGVPATKNGVLEPADAAKLLPPDKDFVVTVLDPGSAPREELRYELSRGTVDLVEDMKVDTAITSGKAPARHGTMDMGRAITIRTIEAGPRGAHVEVDATRVTVSGKSQTGGTIEADVSPAGKLDVTHADWDGPTDFQPSVLVLPDAALGQGARWRLVRRSPDKTALHVEIYTIRSHDHHVIELDVSTWQLMLTPTMRMPDGTQAAVRSYEYRGSGHVTVDTHTLVPTSYDVTAHTRYTISANRVDSVIDSTIATKWSAKAGT